MRLLRVSKWRRRLGGPVISKQGSMRSLYKFSPAAEKTKGVEFKDPKEPVPKKIKFIIRPPKTTEGTVEKEVGKDKEKQGEKEKEKEKEKAAEKPEGDMPKETEAVAIIAQQKAQGPEVACIIGLDQPLHEKEKETIRGKGPEVVKPTGPAHKETATAAGGASAGGNVRSSAFAAG
ncbi:hypothetical protein Hanom_Chr00s091669g01799271 [Helianthus anomalus]